MPPVGSENTLIPGRPLPVVAGVIWLGARLVVQRRGPGGHGAGRLEFPGGKLERQEGPREGLARELVEEWGQAAGALEIGRALDVVRHRYEPPGPDVLLMFFEARFPADFGAPSRLTPEAGAEVVVVGPGQLDPSMFTAADISMATALRAGHHRWTGGR